MKQYESQFRKLTEVGSVNRGKSKHRPRNAPELYGGSYPFIQTGDVKHANFFITDYTQTYSERGLAQSKLWQPGTLCITIAANIADTAILKIPACFPDSIIGFIPAKGKSEVRFIKYCLDTYKKEMQLISQGTTQDNLSQGKLLSLRFRIPDYDQQQKIAAILSAYDELIENNQRRIALLEKMAEEIYREWFVRMRFPGHEKVKKVKGVPEGWQVKKLGDLVRTQYGYTASAETEGDGPKFLRITDIVPTAINWELVPHCKIEEKDEEKYLLQAGDIVVARTGATVGYAKRINKHPPKVVFASYLVRLIPKRKSDAIFLGLSVERNAFKDFIWMFITGAAQPQANATTMALYPVLYPPESILNEFNRIIESILDEKEFLQNQTAILSRKRDMLLPRLISGKLSVEHLDIQFPPGMEESVHDI